MPQSRARQVLLAPTFLFCAPSLAALGRLMSTHVVACKRLWRVMIRRAVTVT